MPCVASSTSDAFNAAVPLSPSLDSTPSSRPTTNSPSSSTEYSSGKVGRDHSQHGNANGLTGRVASGVADLDFKLLWDGLICGRRPSDLTRLSVDRHTCGGILYRRHRAFIRAVRIKRVLDIRLSKVGAPSDAISAGVVESIEIVSGSVAALVFPRTSCVAVIWWSPSVSTMPASVVIVPPFRLRP